MRRGIRQYMGDADKIFRFLHGHRFAVDIPRPYITDALLSLQIVFRHMLHRNRSIFKMLYLPLISIPAFKTGIQHDEGKYGDHDNHINNDDPGFFHRMYRPFC